MNRLTAGKYSGGTTGAYNETFGYDKMGNITNLYRGGLQSNSPGKAFSTIDNLINFNYNGNQLTSVYDNGSSGYFYGNEEFVNNNSNQRAYDANGNMTYDASNCGIWAIGYNVLNLPNAIQFQLGHQTLYTYSATGAKLKVVDKTAPAGVNLPVSGLNTILANPSVASTTTTDYVGNMLYQNGTLQMILLPEGYYQGGYYYYYLKDHLGSNRVVLRNDGYIAETSNYYPSGMRFGESVVSGGSVQPYRHIGKEMQSMHGLNWYDNGARMRQVDIPVWTTLDPLAEKYYSISPYVYCMNNPIRYVDPTGMIWEDPKDIERLNKSVNNRIENINKDNSKIQSQIDKGGLSEKKLAKLQDKLADNSSKIGLLNQSLSDIKAIGEAKETYRLVGPSQNDGTHGVVKGSDDVINIEGSNSGLHIHEIRHVGQSIETGGVRFNKNGQLLNASKTIEGGRNNEVNAYQVQYSYDGTYPTGASSLKDINGNTLMNIKREDGTSVYEQLKDKQ